MQDKKKRSIQWDRLLFWFVFLSLFFSVIFITVELIRAPSVNDPTEEYEKLRSDYALMLVQCFLGLIVLFLPTFLKRTWKVVLPSRMMIIYVLFLYCAIYLGEVRSFYYLIPHWDTILHIFSGSMLGLVGLVLISELNEADGIRLHMSPLFISIFAFCFALAVGAVWEIYEFTIDAVIGTNMQKFALENGAPLIGRAALQDTMVDLIVDALGAFVVSTFGYAHLRRQPKWIENFDVTPDD